MFAAGAQTGYVSSEKRGRPMVDTAPMVVNMVMMVSPAPAFIMSHVLMPLAAWTMALGAVDTGSRNARLETRVQFYN